MSTYRRILRGADNSHPYWVALEEEKCIGENFRTLRNFCEERGLSLSRYGHSVNFDGAFYQVFMFAAEEDAGVFARSSAANGCTRRRRAKAPIGRIGKKVPENLDGWPVPTK